MCLVAVGLVVPRMGVVEEGMQNDKDALHRKHYVIRTFLHHAQWTARFVEDVSLVQPIPPNY